MAAAPSSERRQLLHRCEGDAPVPDAHHHKQTARLKCVLNNGQYLVEHSADPFAARLEQRNKNARSWSVRLPAGPGAGYVELPRKLGAREPLAT